MFGMAGDIKFLLWLLLLSSSSSSFGSELDVQCLKTVQQSMIDPNGILKSSWIFDNITAGSICRFTGVECWHPDENRVLTLYLSNLGLEGQFPKGLQNCTSMTGLDLSSNNFSGPIPSDIAQQLPFLTSLDLSYNSFTGQIPAGISNIVILDTLNLQHNQLSGQIPGQFSLLARLTSFNVSDNLLSGSIPPFFFDRYPASSFAGNLELCYTSLGSCWSTSSDDTSIGMIVAAVGFVLGFVVAFYFPHWFIFSRKLHPYIVRIC